MEKRKVLVDAIYLTLRMGIWFIDTTGSESCVGSVESINHLQLNSDKITT